LLEAVAFEIAAIVVSAARNIKIFFIYIQVRQYECTLFALVRYLNCDCIAISNGK
jgi:hypothetical protein